VSTLFRIDLRFSGSFAEDADGEIVALIAKNAEEVGFELNEDLVEGDLTDGLRELGVQADQFSWVESEKAVFQAPSAFDAPASAASGWPIFTQGATLTRFIRVEADSSEALIMAIHDAFFMASVTLVWKDLAVHDDLPTVVVNAIESFDDVVDPRAPHERRADGLVAAINSAVGSSEES